MSVLSVILTAYIIINYSYAKYQSCDEFQSLCLSITSSCRDCIREHPCCIWCYDENLPDTQRRCFANGTSEHNKCNKAMLENNSFTSVNITQNKPFLDVEDDVNSTVQFSPQEFTIDLRKGEAVNITIQYRPAKNYPLQLYYLMDLTKSMEPDLNLLKTLGSKLTNLLQDLTKHYTIAFGSYIDKPVMPYYRTDTMYFENPCIDDKVPCKKAYLFKHRQDFTNDIDMFMHQVNESTISSNLDEPEGGMEAVMQILLCGGTLGWSEKSRKLILVATEAVMHLAGEGILGGFPERSAGKCRIDSNGNYDSSKYFDYPSLEEVYYRLRDNKTNIIVASKSNSLPFYRSMSKIFNETIFVGKLENGSDNILELVKNGYYDFMKKVKLSTSTQIDGLDVDFFADCNGAGTWERKPDCMNAEEGKVMNFTVQLALNKYQEQSSAELVIKESNIADEVKLKLNFVGSMCECSHLPQTQLNCVHGKTNCGRCLCDDGWTGETCSDECRTNLTTCRYTDEEGTLSLTCSGHGECTCNNCQCNLHFVGPFCQYECPYDRQTKQTCGHGHCIEGKCVCEENYSGTTCDCHNSTENCKIPGSESICNGKGICKCNKCVCDEGYSDRFCDRCTNCTGLCIHYEQNVVDHVINHIPQDGTVRVELMESRSEDGLDCVYRFENEDQQKCYIYYNYKIGNDRSVVVKATEPDCAKPMAAAMLSAWIITAFLLLTGLIVMIWKIRNYRRDQAEYKVFLQNQALTKQSEHNPIYKHPVVTYRNPLNSTSGSAEEEEDLMFPFTLEESKKTKKFL